MVSAESSPISGGSVSSALWLRPSHVNFRNRKVSVGREVSPWFFKSNCVILFSFPSSPTTRRPFVLLFVWLLPLSLSLCRANSACKLPMMWWIWLGWIDNPSLPHPNNPLSTTHAALTHTTPPFFLLSSPTQTNAIFYCCLQFVGK